MRCFGCKRVLGEDDIIAWKFCPGCGTSLREERALLRFEQFFRSGRNRVVFVLLNVCIIGLFAFLAIRSRDDLAKKNSEMQALIEERDLPSPH